MKLERLIPYFLSATLFTSQVNAQNVMPPEFNYQQLRTYYNTEEIIERCEATEMNMTCKYTLNEEVKLEIHMDFLSEKHKVVYFDKKK